MENNGLINLKHFTPVKQNSSLQSQSSINKLKSKRNVKKETDNKYVYCFISYYICVLIAIVIVIASLLSYKPET